MPANTTTFTDTGLSAATTYYYEVITTSNVGDAAPSNAVAIVTAAKIAPGIGFTGATAQPATIGDPSQFGYNDNAIANWDVVPNQTFTGDFNVGVVAFHNSGIDHVAFSVNGGAWTNVSAMTANPQTANTSGIGNANASGIVEYWATLQASDFTTDGQVEVRAIAYPKIGVPRVLSSLYLNSNSNGSLTRQPVYVSTTGSDSTGDGTQAKPFATIFRAAKSMNNGTVKNGLIYLLPGDYSWAVPTMAGPILSPDSA